MDGIAKFAEHVARAQYEDLPPAAVQAAKTWILDTLGVGFAGSAGPFVEELIACNRGWGQAAEARCWVRGAKLPAPAAAMVNAYQIHNSEFDCVHEKAVVHPMAVLLAATLAHAERAGGVSGRELILAVALGVDLAAGLGVAAKSGLRFFRPATAGAFAATGAIGKLMGFDAERLVNAFGATYAQLCGNMQAHTEGSMLLGMQIGFNARNAVVACDMAAKGLVGPRNLLEGPFGYFRLFELEYDLAPVLAELGRTWLVTEVAHKPFPSGRATHGVVDGCMELKRAQGFRADEVERVTALVPPLVHQLVGRPAKGEMHPNYARLCAAFVAATALRKDFVGVEDFAPAALNDAATIALAKRFDVRIDGNPDRNALTPVTVEIVLKGGRSHAITLEVVYGNPGKPMSREAHLQKFRRNCAAAATPLASGEALIAAVDELEKLDDARRLVDLCVAG